MGRFNIEDKKVLAGIDLGASHVRCLIGVRSANEVTIAGSASATHKGLYKGAYCEYEGSVRGPQKKHRRSGGDSGSSECSYFFRNQ